MGVSNRQDMEVEMNDLSNQEYQKLDFGENDSALELNKDKICDHLHPLRRSNWVQIFPFLALVDFGRIGGGRSNVLEF
jgi:hypothetical protein